MSRFRAFTSTVVGCRIKQKANDRFDRLSGFSVENLRKRPREMLEKFRLEAVEQNPEEISGKIREDSLESFRDKSLKRNM